MMKILLLLVVVIAAVNATAKRNAQDIADFVNKQETTWTATVYPRFTDIEDAKKFLGFKLRPDGLPMKKPTNIKLSDIPKEFDARTTWPQCKSIVNIGDQSKCRSSWAYSTANTMTDRICIHLKETNVNVSAADLISCCNECGSGCDGGDHFRAFLHWRRYGIVTGGDYGSEQGCKPYPFPPCEHGPVGSRPSCDGDLYPTPECKAECRPGYSGNYTNDKIFGIRAYYLKNSQEEIMAEILSRGPVVVFFDVFQDFVTYKTGIYKHTTGNIVDGQMVRLIGWGEENGVKYWLCANSWNTDWGENGFFRILRGNNECRIEDYAVSGMPRPMN